MRVFFFERIKLSPKRAGTRSLFCLWWHQRNRILGFSSGSFNEEHEARKAYRGFTYNNPNVDKVAWQRSTAKYTT